MEKSSKNILKQIPFAQVLLFTILLVGSAVFQNNIKANLQFFLLFLSGIAILSFHLDEPKGSRIFFYLILSILLFENVFQGIEWFRISYSNPDETGMNLGGLISLLLGLIMSPAGVITYHYTANRLTKTEELVSWCFSIITLFLLIKSLIW